jgi:hypothetical protein
MLDLLDFFVLALARSRFRKGGEKALHPLEEESLTAGQ